MARLARGIFITLIFTLLSLAAFSPKATAGLFDFLHFAPTRDCLETSLDWVNSKRLDPGEQKKLEGAVYYNDWIFKKFSELPKDQWKPSVETTINHFAEYDLGFRARTYKKWLRDHPEEIDPTESIGSYLKRNHEEFSKNFPKAKIEDLVDEMPEEMKKIAKECGEDVKCHRRKITAILSDKFKNTCLGEHFGVAFKSMVTALAFSNMGYALTTAKDPEHNYPLDLTITNILWTPIMATVGCRNTLERGSIGNKIDFGQRVTFSTETAKIKSNAYINYIVLSPLSNATYVGFHTAFQVGTGKKDWKDVKVWDLAKQTASLTLYDGIYPIPRGVFLNDPLYLKGIPAIEGYLGRTTPRAVAVAGTYAADWGARLGLSYVNSAFFNLWSKKSDEWWDTNFGADKKKVENKKGQ